MKVKVAKKGKAFVEVVLEDVNASIANALRRVMLSEVPCLSIEDVTFLENTSSLYDEIIAHRLGLVPIRTDLKLFNFRDKCACGGAGCASCTLKLTLEKEGPCTVYSHDMKPEDPKLKPQEGIPILRLGNGQKIAIEAEAILGTGKTNAKWQSAIVSYKYRDGEGAKAKGDNRSFILRIEGNGALKPEEIFTKACEILEAKATEMASLL
ncbi:MAG: DNA-directed RNA polymerase subunit D [Euryarchaeota archaeon]|nr:DNA-directed RNA polymerase subunit D [Euryarchaeota archaeon]